MITQKKLSNQKEKVLPNSPSLVEQDIVWDKATTVSTVEEMMNCLNS